MKLTVNILPYIALLYLILFFYIFDSNKYNEALSSIAQDSHVTLIPSHLLVRPFCLETEPRAVWMR